MIKGVQRQVENPRKGVGGKRQAKSVLLNQREDRLWELETRAKNQENQSYQLMIELERDYLERGNWCKHVGISEKRVELETGA